MVLSKKSIMVITGLLIFFAICVGQIISCASSKAKGPSLNSFTAVEKTSLNISKGGTVLDNGVNETTPFVWEGKLKYLTSEGRLIHPFHLAIYDFETKTQTAKFGEGLTMASALVFNNKLYVFAAKEVGQHMDKKIRSEIYVIISEDLKSFSEPVLVARASDIQGFFNTTVTRNSDTGKFIMALELYEEGLVMFSFRFLESDDLIKWKFISPIFGNQYYVACPSIRYLNGSYYLWYMKETYTDPQLKDAAHRIYTSHLARSKDLVQWEISPQTFIAPDLPDEGINTSDVDLVEWNEKTHILYMVGDQATWSKVKLATANMTLTELVDRFFKP